MRVTNASFETESFVTYEKVIKRTFFTENLVRFLFFDMADLLQIKL